MTENEFSNKVEASIGVSRKWDAREAGREVAKSTLKKLKRPPNFFLLFSTIHYKDNGGFQELLNGIWDVLPEGTPLIGGTIAGFINNYGCYARGVTALAVSYSKMDVSIGMGKHTKRNPKKAAIRSAKIIRNELKTSNYDNKFLVNVISGPIVPNLPHIPLLKEINFIKSKILGTLFSHIGLRILAYLGYGVGKEDEVIEHLIPLLPKYYIIGGSALDNGIFSSNYQFFKDRVCTNSIVTLGCSTDLPVFLKATTGLQNPGKSFNVTGFANNRRVITRIENKKAKDYFFKDVVGLSEDQFKNLGAFYYKFSYYFPISLDDIGAYSTGIGGISGNDIVLGHRIKNNSIAVNFVKGNEIIDIVDHTFPNYVDFPFMLMFSSAIYTFILGNKIFEVKDHLDKRLGTTPYLVVQPTIENVKLPDKEAYVSTYAFNALSLKAEGGARR